MAVYTVLERKEIADLIKPFGIGSLLEFQGVSDGIENTSYFISTDHSHVFSDALSEPVQHYVLTVFEELTVTELPFYIELTTALHRARLPVPCPLTDSNGLAIQLIAGKPALLFPKVRGNHPVSASLKQCHAIGETLARIHLLSQQLPLHHSSNRDSAWLIGTARKVSTFVQIEDQLVIQEQLRDLCALLEQDPPLPKGIIHNDLFRDNTLFVDARLNGIIDFYNACSGYFLQDLAITVNDWCSAANGSLDAARYNSLLRAYAAVRPFTAAEQTHWNTFLRICACRFWLSRLLALHFPQSKHREGCLMPRKDPNQYKTLLLQRRNCRHFLPEIADQTAL